jgi:hypothetical protein
MIGILFAEQNQFFMLTYGFELTIRSSLAHQAVAYCSSHGYCLVIEYRKQTNQSSISHNKGNTTSTNLCSDSTEETQKSGKAILRRLIEQAVITPPACSQGRDESQNQS